MTPVVFIIILVVIIALHFSTVIQTWRIKVKQAASRKLLEDKIWTVTILNVLNVIVHGVTGFPILFMLAMGTDSGEGIGIISFIANIYIFLFLGLAIITFLRMLHLHIAFRKTS